MSALLSALRARLTAWRTVVRPRLRPTIRMRLTLIYGGIFGIAALALVSVIYVLVQNRSQRVSRTFIGSVTDPGVSGAPPSGTGPTGTVVQAIESYNAGTLSALLRYSLLGVAVVLCLAVFIAWVVAGRILRPLQEITATARRVADRSLHERIAMQGPRDEVKELADTFDAMLERLDQSFAGQRRFVANASHELRTPLAINRTLLEVALGDPEVSTDTRQLGRTLLATNERSERLIDGLLTMASSENELSRRAPVDLADVGGQALEQVATEASKHGVQLYARLGPAPVSGDGVLLERLALNLMQNGVRYNTADGWIEAVTQRENGISQLVVTNSGPVIAPYEVEGLFEPFRRLGDERTRSTRGVGLGLSIVRSVARAHGGLVTAEPRDGGGLVVRVTLPAHRVSTSR